MMRPSIGVPAFDCARQYSAAWKALGKALAEACGDHTGKDGDYTSLAGYLDYPCDPELSPDAAAAAVAALRADPNLLPLLRLQITTLDTNLGGLDTTNNIRLRQRLQAFVKASH